MTHWSSNSRFSGPGVIAVMLSIISVTATASDLRVPTERFTEYAKVLKVEPVYQQLSSREPRQRCWTEQERHLVGYERITPSNEQHRHQHSAQNTIVGGLIGGVIGNQVGRGYSDQSRTGATVAGAIIGSAIGNESSHRTQHKPSHRITGQVRSTPIYEIRDVQHCERTLESRTHSQLQHYNVTYRYRGRTFVTQLRRDPGKKLELQVSIAPARNMALR